MSLKHHEVPFSSTDSNIWRSSEWHRTAGRSVSYCMDNEFACPACKEGKMKPFQKVRRLTGVITTYWRCTRCAHIRIEESAEDDFPAG